MAAAQLMLPANRAFNSNGLAVRGAVAYLYTTGTTTPQPFYSDSGLSVSLGSSITANGAGRFPTAYQDNATPFRLRIEDADGAELEDIDPFYFGTTVLDVPSATFATRTALAAQSGTAGANAFLAESGREGEFVWSSTNFATLYGASLATVDPNQILYVPPTSAPTGASGAWVRKTDRLTPRMAGCTPYNPSSEVWCDDELNAFYKLATYPQIARQYVFDASGEWGVADKIWAVYWDGAEPNVDRRFVAPTLRVAPIASLPGAAALDVAFEIAGYHMIWEGMGGVHPAGVAQRMGNYSDRRYEIGVRRRFCNSSSFDGFYVDDAKYEGVWDYSDSGTWTHDGVTFPHANNIGMAGGLLVVRDCGSSSVYGYGATPQTISAKTQGGASSGDWGTEVFDATAATYANTGSQRTRLTVGSTSHLRQLDTIWTRLELTPSIYGTIAADSGTKTITWSAGDPTTYLSVGDLYPVFLAGPNLGVQFRIVSFGGTSNRTITVDVAPTSHAATADPTYQQNGIPTWHTVSMVQDSTHLLVYPWVPDRNNSTMHISSGGGLRVSGSDSANVKYKGLIAFGCGVGYHGTAQYAPKFDTMLLEGCDIGALLGHPNDAFHAGLEVSHGHAEANVADVVNRSNNSYATINFTSSNDFDKWRITRPRLTTNTQEPKQTLGFGQIDTSYSGYKVQTSRTVVPYDPTAPSTISNAPASRDAFVHTDSPTITVSADWTVARLFAKHHWARIIWTDDDGTAPDGTLTLTLDTALSAAGWSFAGAGSGTSVTISAPSQSVGLHLQYLFTAKKVALTRFQYSPDTGPWTVSGATISLVQDDEYLITMTSTDSWGAAAWFATDGDFRLRVKPQQTNQFIGVGVDNVAGTVVTNASMDEHLMLRSDGGYTASTGTTANAGPTYAYASGDTFWFERIGTVGKIYVGATFATATLYHTFAADVSDSDFAKIIMNGGAIKVRHYPIVDTFAAASVTIGAGTALTKAAVYTPSITPASVAAATVAEQTFTVTGLTTADKVVVNPPAIANATGIVGARVSAADTLAIRFVNPTAGALTPSSGTYTVLAFRS